MTLEYFNDVEFDFFISHNGETTAEALELYKILKEKYPERSIFLDVETKIDGVPVFNSSEDNSQLMNEATAVSKILIFITKSQEDTFKGNGNMPKEIKYFSNWQTNRLKNGRPDYNLSMFGIFLCNSNEVDFLNTKNIFDSEVNHLFIGTNGKIQDHLNELFDRINKTFAHQKNFPNNYAPIILDKVNLYYEKRKEFFNVEEYISPEFFNVEEYISPTFKKSDSKNHLDLESFYEKIEQDNVIILGEDGGIGKTSLMKAIFTNFLKENSPFVPIWIDAKDLCENDFIFARYIERELFNPDALLNKNTSSEEIQNLVAAFKKGADKKSFLFLIDGFNEISPKVAASVSKQLNGTEQSKGIIDEYASCRFVISCRGNDDALPTNFNKFEIAPLQKDFVKKYLKERKFPQKLNDTLYKILSIPMYLKLYCASNKDTIVNKGQLIYNSLKTIFKQSGYEEKIFTEHLLPFIAYNMVIEKTFHITMKDVIKYIKLFREMVSDNDEYLDYYGYDDALLEQFEQIPENALSIRTYANKFKEAIVNTYHILKVENDNEFEFIHQVYRDFLCSQFIVESIKRYAATGCNLIFDIFEPKKFDEDIREFSSDLLTVIPSECNDAALVNYCDDPVLMRAIDKLRNSNEKNAAKLIGFLILILNIIRKNDLAGLDFSNLDLTESNLNSIIFSRRENGSLITTSFENSIINCDNLFVNTHEAFISAACLNDNCFASIDANGTLLIWGRHMLDSVPLKRIEGLKFGIKKMRFSEDENVIYAMTNNEILSINYSESLKIDKLFKSKDALKNFFIENGKIYFTTILNPFNKKPIDNPTCEDEVNFKYFTSTSTVNQSKDTLVFADNAGHNGLKIYKKNGERFEEFKWGYLLYLEQFCLEIEEQLKVWGVYDKFTSDDKTPGARRTYFIIKQNYFSDRSHDYHEGIIKLLDFVKDELKRLRPHFESHSYTQKLDSIADKYVALIKDFQKEHPIAIKLTGRKILSVDFASDNKTVLISTLLEYNNNWAIYEFNTENLDCREIAFKTLKHTRNLITAEYFGEEILNFSKVSIAGYNKERKIIRKLNLKAKQISSIIYPENSDKFYAFSQTTVHEISAVDGRVLHVFPNRTGYAKVEDYYCEKENPNSKLFKMCKTNANEDSILFITIDGKIKKLNPDKVELLPTVSNKISQFMVEYCENNIAKQYKVSRISLACYIDNLLQDKKKLQFGLYICGCNFKNISGDILENSEAMKTLIDYSAKTSFDLPNCESAPKNIIDEGDSLTISCDNINDFSREQAAISHTDNIKLSCKTIIRTSNLDKLTIASNISNHNFDYLDYFFLMWLYRLQVVNQDMLFRLAQAASLNIENEKTVIEWLRLFFEKLDFLDKFNISFSATHSTDFYSLSERKGIPFIKDLLKEQYAMSAGEQRIGHLLQMCIQNSNGQGNANKSKALTFRELNDDKIIDNFIKISKKFALNEWFTKTFKQFKGFTDYNFSVLLDSATHFDARGDFDAILRTDNHDFIVLSFRRNYSPLEAYEKIKRANLIALNYKTVYTHNDVKVEFSKKPQILILCEDYQQCIDVHNKVKEEGLNATLLYTYDKFNSKANPYDFFSFGEDGIYGMNFK